MIVKFNIPTCSTQERVKLGVEAYWLVHMTLDHALQVPAQAGVILFWIFGLTVPLATQMSKWL